MFEWTYTSKNHFNMSLDLCRCVKKLVSKRPVFHCWPLRWFFKINKICLVVELRVRNLCIFHVKPASFCTCFDQQRDSYTLPKVQCLVKLFFLGGGGVALGKLSGLVQLNSGFEFCTLSVFHVWEQAKKLIMTDFK